MIGPAGGGPTRVDDRVGPMNPQLAVRVAIVGSIALVMFAVIFLRLWFLQVLSGSQYVAQAKTNIVRRVPVPAPRGSILAANGAVLVNSVKVPAILVAPQTLPVPLTATLAGVNDPPADQRVYRRLAVALGMSTRPSTCRYTLSVDNAAGTLVAAHFAPKLAAIPCIVAQHAADITLGTITVATDVPVAEQAYISEHETEFPGVEVSQVSLSEYPQGALAAQILGTVGANANSATGGPLFGNVPAYDEVGQTGLEFQYNRYLQGHDGYARVEVNAQGQYQGETTPVPPTPGDNLRTSINLGLEQVGTRELQAAINNVGGNYGGAFVAMNPVNGQIDAMGSLPSYNPSIFNHPLTQQQYDQQFGANSGDPLLDRAIQSVGPVGSTYKVITATAALQSGQWQPNETFDDATGQFCVSGQCLSNAPGDGALGNINIEQAIEVSDDVFFYHLGALMNVQNPFTQPQGGALQAWSKRFQINRAPGIDLPYAAAGTIPTPAFVEDRIKAEEQCDAGTGPYRYYEVVGGQYQFSATPAKGYVKTPVRPQGYCGIALLPNPGWTVGDNMHMAIGQGDVQVSPLQLTMVYAAMANGGYLVTPHVGEQIETPSGQVVEKISPGPRTNLHISPVNLQTIDTGLRLAASGPIGTSTNVMGSFPLPVYAKTGTADYIPTSGPNKGVDTAYAWYAAYVPPSATSKPIVIVVWVEDGGYGDATAAPVAREMLSQWFYGHTSSFTIGTSAFH
ncbi:penicillin-binding protein 2 [Conexibacter sp. DBS9H8]|uniref:peptidoglycan D,D-transpeptidase FtsI family protein n=1 Tax=Conexibacter sp. DBS9H8 TaxID=2937801 RepID=UPI00200FDDBB|nr:penicillin-binding transpeptidase domain-containing protein [Conexibacter sp. DBS9H8]